MPKPPRVLLNTFWNKFMRKTCLLPGLDRGVKILIIGLIIIILSEYPDLLLL
jgi:hypothetical protein